MPIIHTTINIRSLLRDRWNRDRRKLPLVYSLVYSYILHVSSNSSFQYSDDESSSRKPNLSKSNFPVARNREIGKHPARQQVCLVFFILCCKPPCTSAPEFQLDGRFLFPPRVTYLTISDRAPSRTMAAAGQLLSLRQNLVRIRQPIGTYPYSYTYSRCRHRLSFVVRRCDRFIVRIVPPARFFSRAPFARRATGSRVDRCK